MYIIENITTKDVNTKFGPKPAYTIIANGEKFSYGFKKPTFAVGDTVDFQFTESTYGKQVDATSVRMITKGTGAPTTATVTSAPAKSYTPATKVFPIPPLHGDRAIVRQNSITNATKLVSDMQAKSKSEIDVMLLANTIVEVAKVFEAYSCGDNDAMAAELLASGE
jgi:hypothetical protein